MTPPITRLLLALCLCSAHLTAQKTGNIYLPPHTNETPAFFKVFYDPDFPEDQNIFALDSAAVLYEKELESKQERPQETEIITGEEQEDAYLLYYKRWRRSVDEFIQSNGTLLSSENHHAAFTTPRTSKTNSPTSSWSLVGPVETYWKYQDNAAQPPCTEQINMYCCVIAPSNANVLYASAETGGVYKTINKGLSWTLVLDENSTYDALIVNPSNPNIAYAGRNNTIKRTSDGGITWISATPSCGNVNALAINPSATNTIFAATANGLYKSTDGGATWALSGGMNTTIYDVWLKTNDPNTIFIIRKNGGLMEFWKSADGGNSFIKSMNGWTPVNGSGARLTVTKADPNRLYVVVLGAAPDSTAPYIYRSNDAGQSWTLACRGITSGLAGNNSLPLGMSNGQGYYDLAILANPNNANEVMVATTSAYKSTDGAQTFNRFGGYGGNFSIHPDVQWMAAAGNDTWIATDGGMNYSTDFFTSTVNFSTRNNGLFGSDFWGFTQGWNEDIMAGGRYHNGNTVISENYPYSKALRMGGAESPTGHYMMGRSHHVAFSDISDVVVPATLNGASSNFSFNKYPNGDAYGFDASDVEFLPYSYNTVFVGEGNELWKSANGGISWVSVHNFAERVKHFEISRSNPDVIYLATASHFYKSTNSGVSWIQLAMPAGISYYNLEIAVDFTNENNLWICSPNNSSNNRVFKSVNGGSSWINLTTSTINGRGYRNIVHQAGTDGGVYIVGNGGYAYYRNNSMSDWVDFSNSLPNGMNPLRSIPFYRDGKLRTAGSKGVWQVDFYENSVPIAQPMVDKLTSNCPRDTFYFEDFSALQHAGASWNWSFSPAPAYVSSATIRNPKVVFGAAGTYDYSLMVSNGAGNDTKTVAGKLVISGNACGTDTVPGKLLNLQNAGDYAEAQEALGITTNTITMSCWIKPKGTQVTGAGILFSASNGACGLNFKSNNQLGYHWNDEAGSYGWNGGPTVPADAWSHVALVITPTSATIYLNGVAYTRTATHISVNFSAAFQMGIDRSNTARNYKGLMDEVCFYNRVLSQNEIRELMNLTRNNPNAGSLPAKDNSLIAYYQFNEGDGTPAYDKAGLNHVNLVGATATKNTVSTAPVGGGNFQRQAISASGTYNFAKPAVEITCPAGGTYPGGDVVVSRLNVPSDQLCYSSILPEPAAYYIIRNYGNNGTFTNLSSIKFSSVQGTTTAMATAPVKLKLYMRSANADGAVWMKNDSADVVTDNNGTGTVKFSTGLQLSSFGQLSIANQPGSNVVDIPDKEESTVLAFTLLPNPSNTGWFVMNLKSPETIQHASVKIYDELGRLIKAFYLQGSDLQQPVHFHVPGQGIYFVSVHTDKGKAVSKKVVVD